MKRIDGRPFGYKGMGWRRDLPDFRDHGVFDPSTPGEGMKKLGERMETGAMPDVARFDDLVPPVKDQGPVGACTGFAATTTLETLEKRIHGSSVPKSPWFTYKATRRIAGDVGDTGAEIRTTLKALAMVGASPASAWSVDSRNWDKDPDWLAVSMAQNYQALKYARLDTAKTTRPTLLYYMRRALASRWPLMLGFTCYDSLESVGADGCVPFPTDRERVLGGHAITLCGYDVMLVCPNATAGAFRFVNSWSAAWGEGGFGWLPFDYVLRGALDDVWTLSKAEWIDEAVFA